MDRCERLERSEMVLEKLLFICTFSCEFKALELAFHFLEDKDDNKGGMSAAYRTELIHAMSGTTL